MKTFYRLSFAVIGTIASIVILAPALATLIPGCVSRTSTASTQPATAPATDVSSALTLLQILQTSLTDAQGIISAAEAYGLISGPTATEINAIEKAAIDALALANGSPTDQALIHDATSKIKALVTHPAVVAAKAKTKLVAAGS